VVTEDNQQMSSFPTEVDADARYAVNLGDYENQLLKLQHAMTETPINKFSLIHYLYQHNHVLTEHVTPLINKINRKEGESDFAITPLIRCLYYKQLDKVHALRTERVNFRPSTSKNNLETTRNQNTEESKSLPTNDTEETTGTAPQSFTSLMSDPNPYATHSLVDHTEEFEAEAITRPSEALQNMGSPTQQVAAINALNNDILKTLASFPFWPTMENAGTMNSIVFWSENHLFMTLGSAYLYHQYLDHFLEDADKGDEGSSTAVGREPSKQDKEYHYKRRIEALLLIYLRAHEHFSGVYEVGSHVYLPYSLAGLLNLYDFAIDPEISKMAENIIHRLVFHLMLGTDPWKGIANLTGTCLCNYFIDGTG
jgi:hypothetical protein